VGAKDSEEIRAPLELKVLGSIFLWVLAAVLLGAAEAIHWLKYGHLPNWSPLALGWWNPAEHPTGWAGVDRILHTVSEWPLPFLCVMAGLAWVLAGLWLINAVERHRKKSSSAR
jgi:hypothetical protein